MNPIEAIARALFIEQNSIAHDHEALWTTCRNRGLYFDLARAALIALRDHEETPPAAVAWIVKMMEKQP